MCPDFAKLIGFGVFTEEEPSLISISGREEIVSFLEGLGSVRGKGFDQQKENGMRVETLVQFGFGQGFGIERDNWRNQYGYGIFFKVRAGFFRFELSFDRLRVQ